jgi:hypothetical protein
MYFPYLRGKQFELEALLEVPFSVYNNTLPILEPVNLSRRNFYTSLAARNVPFVLITNPFYPENNRVTGTALQNLIDNDLASHVGLRLGFIIDTRFDIASLNFFLTSNPTRDKVLIFRYSPMPADLIAIQTAISTNPVDYIVLDEQKTNTPTRSAFSSNAGFVLLTNGFQRQDSNSNYPVVSTFDSNFNSWRASGWAGIGDYVTIGDHFQEGGGQVYVVSLHITVQSPTGIEAHHYSSTTNAGVRGLPAQKFSEANRLLVNSPVTIPLNSGGLDIYRDLHNRAHNPQLGVAKKASIIHHIELMSSII